MTNAEKTSDLAEKVMGWKIGDPASLGVPAWFRNGLCMATYFWDPFTSRDDLAQLLGKLTDEQWARFSDELCQIMLSESAQFKPASTSVVRLTLTATPAQVAEAVWRATCQ